MKKQKGKMKMISEKEFEEAHKTFEQVKEEMREWKKLGCKEFMKKFVYALKYENPFMDKPEIRKTILEDHEIRSEWSERTIRNNWPDYVKNPKHQAAATQRNKERWGNKDDEILPDSSKITEEDIQQEEEETPVSSETPWEREESHPETERTPYQLIGNINRALARLFETMTDKHNMPTTRQDLKKDFIIPTRAFFTDFVNATNKAERDYLLFWMQCVDQCLHDRMEVVKGSDKTAYDTREDKAT